MGESTESGSEIKRTKPAAWLVYQFWETASCGEDLYLKGHDRRHYSEQAHARYLLEPYIAEFAEFEYSNDMEVLEIGVGLGADHQKFAEAGAILTGIDLTPRAIEHVKRRLDCFNFRSDLRVADAEDLPFTDNRFDIVYSWGVIHHSPNTEAAAREILRVLRPGGRFAVMIYHRYSLVGYMLWLRYALARGRFFRSLDSVYADHLESPGTKAYSKAEAEELFAGASELRVRTVLTHGDLLESRAGQRHSGPLLSLARAIWPRWALRRIFKNHGLFMLIDGRKPDPEGAWVSGGKIISSP